MKKETLLGLTGDEILNIIKNSPLVVKNTIRGYVAEVMLGKYLKTIPEIESVERGSFMDRSTDFIVKYKNKSIRIENKKIKECKYNRNSRNIHTTVQKIITNSSEVPYILRGSIDLQNSRITRKTNTRSTKKEEFEIVCCSILDEDTDNIHFIFANAHNLKTITNPRTLVIDNPSDYLKQYQIVTYPPQKPWTTNIIEVLDEQIKYNKSKKKKKKEITLF